MPSIGKDLATIRKHLGLSILDIQNATKIPLNTLESIENDSIFDDSEEIQTYIRSFVRSYGRALKLEDDQVVEALDRHEVGGYDHHLLKPFPELAPSEPKPEKPEPKEPVPEERDEKQDERLSKSRFTPDFPDEKEKPTGRSEKEKKVGAAPEKVYKPTPPPGVRSINWADLGKRFSTHKNNTPAKIFGVAAVILLVSAVAYYLFTNDFFISDDLPQTEAFPVPEETMTGGDESNLALDIVESEEAQNPVSAELEDTLYLTIYAVTNRLEPVRVWSDLKPRIDPYWLEQGVAFNYEFRDTIRIRGQYSRMILFLNGHRIDNFRQEFYNAAENSVELTRDLFNSDPKWANPVPFELPPDVAEPDSVALRPSF